MERHEKYETFRRNQFEMEERMLCQKCLDLRLLWNIEIVVLKENLKNILAGHGDLSFIDIWSNELIQCGVEVKIAEASTLRNNT